MRSEKKGNLHLNLNVLPTFYGLAVEKQQKKPEEGFKGRSKARELNGSQGKSAIQKDEVKDTSREAKEGKDLEMLVRFIRIDVVGITGPCCFRRMVKEHTPISMG